MKHYVLLLEWSVDGKSDIQILNVSHDLESAVTEFVKFVKEERKLASVNGYTIDTHTQICFRAYRQGRYTQDYVNICIVAVD